MRVKISKTCTTPRSGVGLDELLGRTSVDLQAFPENRLWQELERDVRRVCARCALAEGLRGPQRDSEAQSRAGKIKGHQALAKMLDSQQATIFHGCGLTPELSRTDLRRCASED